jgi:outer membrane protein insertion porin family
LAKRPATPLIAILAATLGCSAAGCAMPGSSPWGATCPYGSCGQPTAEHKVVPSRREGPSGAQPHHANWADSPNDVAAASGPGNSRGQHELTIRSQSPSYHDPYSSYPSQTTPGGYPRSPQPVSGGVPTTTYAPGTYPAPAAPPLGTGVQPQPTLTYQQPGVAPQFAPPPLPPPPGMAAPAAPAGAYPFYPEYPGFQPPSNFGPEFSATPTPLDIFVEETRTGRFMFGITVNSDAGVAGQITIDERNFDITRPPTSWDDFVEGRAWRGAGQGFRIEAQPGDQVQRYLVSFTEPYFLNTNVSFSASAFYYDRRFFDWDESRYGGRLMWGYRLTPDLSLSGAIRAENINIYDPRVLGVPELDRALGKNDLFSGRVTLTHDTRDLPFMPTEGHLIELAYEQAFGSFDYPRGEVDYSQYFLVRQRPDGSGRHTLAYSTRLGFTGADTPIFENYFAGGFSTLRGFAFRGASPVDSTVRVGGQFRWLNTVEYFFPITADDMIKGTFFCDFGTVERDIALRGDNFRVAPGFGLRINVPALGPAPLAFDFAFPIASAATDQEQVFSFFFGAMR